jgi:cytochrome c oxidase assembly protein subunit 11
VHLHLGETRTVEFRVTNESDQPAAALATFNVQPDLAAQYFNKVSCFCFTETVLKPHETRDLPVVFFVDPALAKDKDIRSLTSITLSYTLFASKTGRSQASTAAPTSLN